MYKSINIFTSESDFESVRAVLPHISLNYIEETNVIKCVERPNYFYIESLEDDNVVSFGVDDTWLGEKKSNVFYSFNKTSWFSLSLVSSLTLSANQYVYFKSNGSNLQKGEYTGNPTSNAKNSLFKTTKKFNVGGNVKLLLHQNDDISSGGCQCLFYSLQVVDASNLVLPATKLASHCYNSMFYNCTSLTAAPELPATELVNSCYSNMFGSCTSLTTAPELPATVLAESCYNSMFEECTSLITAPELPATELADGCYTYMFYDCTRLTSAPELPAIKLYRYCYSNMFRSCTSLTTAPELPATVLAESCYNSMFEECTSLITAPELPATELVNSCYSSMFGSCTSLTTAPELPATTLAESCYSYMFYECNSLVTAPELPATELAYDCYGYMFDGCTNLNYIKCLATDISASRCTDNWVNGVSSTGTFVKHPDMNDWSTGINGIPEGWTIENAEIPCVTFTALEDNSSVGLEKLSTNQTLKYSTDNSIWNTFDITTNILLNNGDKVYVRGMLSADNTDSNYTQFKMTGQIAASGNCNALWNYDDLNAPLKGYCGNYMFNNCTSLTVAPELPATELAYKCYGHMFKGCTSLTTAPVLSTTELADWCYCNMFKNCSSLTVVPELPATTLTSGCYYGMFNDCTSLTTAPELPATTLAKSCYYWMFYGCNKLNYIKCLATDRSAVGCTYFWVKGVSFTGTFIKHPDATGWYTGNEGIPKYWTVVDAEIA